MAVRIQPLGKHQDGQLQEGVRKKQRSKKVKKGRMFSKFLLTVAFCLLCLSSTVAAKIDCFGVRGMVTCELDPQKRVGVKVSLMDEDWLRDDVMGTTYTDTRGGFVIYGCAKDPGWFNRVDPFITIKHRCTSDGDEVSYPLPRFDAVRKLDPETVFRDNQQQVESLVKDLGVIKMDGCIWHQPKLLGGIFLPYKKSEPCIYAGPPSAQLLGPRLLPSPFPRMPMFDHCDRVFGKFTGTLSMPGGINCMLTDMAAEHYCEQMGATNGQLQPSVHSWNVACPKFLEKMDCSGENEMAVQANYHRIEGSNDLCFFKAKFEIACSVTKNLPVRVTREWVAECSDYPTDFAIPPSVVRYV